MTMPTDPALTPGKVVLCDKEGRVVNAPTLDWMVNYDGRIRSASGIITDFPNDAERDVRKHLKARLKTLGGELRKCSWFPRGSAPDELVLVPARGGNASQHFLAELKRPGKEPTDAQWREIKLLRSYGLDVRVLDSREAVDAALFW